MSKERARRREEREREAAVRTAARAAQAERQARQAARRRQLTGWVPARRRRPSGVLAARERRRTGWLVVVLALLNVLVWVLVDAWSARALAAALTVLLGPVLFALFARTT